MAFPTLRGADPNAAEKRDFLAALHVLDHAAKKSEAAAKAFEKVVALEKQLAEKGEKDFVRRSIHERRTIDNFFGDYGQTTRGRAYVMAKNAPAIAGNAIGAVKDDILGLLTGSDKALKDQGFTKNSLFARLLGSERFSAPDSIEDEEQPVIDKHSVELLEKIEQNTDGMVKALSTDRTMSLRRDKHEDLQNREAMLESKFADWRPGAGGAAARGKALRESRDKSLLDRAGDQASSLFESVIGGVTGAALAPLVAGALKKAPVVAATTAMIGGLLWAAVDGVMGFFKAGDWGTSKTSAVIGSILGGTQDEFLGALAGAGKWALVGAGIGKAGGLPGIIAGSLIGAAVGAVLGWFGGERISKMIDSATVAVGKWSDEIFGTAFQLDPETLQREVAALKEKSSKNEAEMKSTLEAVGRIDAEIASVRETASSQELEALKRRRDALLESARKMAREDAETQEKLKAAEDDLASARKSLLGKVSDAAMRWVVEPFGVLSDMIFGTTLQLDSEKIRASQDSARQALAKIEESRTALASKIESLNTDIAKAAESGDQALVASLTRQRDVLSERKDSLDAQAREQETRLEEASRLLVLSKNRLVDWLSAGVETALGLVREATGAREGESLSDSIMRATSDKFKSLKSLVVDFATSVSDWLKRVFSWDYWFGQAADGVSKVREDARRAEEIERRRGQLVSAAERQVSRLFGAEDEAAKSAIKDFKEGKIDEAEFRRRLEQIQSGETNSRRRGDAGQILEGLQRFQSFSERMRESRTVEESERQRASMSETNARQDEAERNQRREEARGMAVAVGNVVNNTTVNNTGIISNVSPHNDDPSFAAGIAGTRNTAYGH